MSITFRKVIDLYYVSDLKCKTSITIDDILSMVLQSFHHKEFKNYTRQLNLLSTVPQAAEYFPTVQLRSVPCSTIRMYVHVFF